MPSRDKVRTMEHDSSQSRSMTPWTSRSAKAIWSECPPSMPKAWSRSSAASPGPLAWISVADGWTVSALWLKLQLVQCLLPNQSETQVQGVPHSTPRRVRSLLSLDNPQFACPMLLQTWWPYVTDETGQSRLKSAAGVSHSYNGAQQQRH